MTPGNSPLSTPGVPPENAADIPHTGFGDCGCADCWPADPIGCSDAALVRHAWEHSTACGVFTNDDARCTCKEDAAPVSEKT